ncbi:MAG: caspase family protein [Asgard group archaeon]|nr:caspase family protein [Asgard group archaeon]
MIKTKKLSLTFFLISLISLFSIFPQFINLNHTKAMTKGVKRYGFLIDQFAPNSNQPGSYSCNAIEFRSSLLQIGWEESDFHYLFGVDEITVANLRDKMEYFENTVDENDVVVVFFATHGHTFLRDILDFNSWFHEEFLELKTPYKLLLIDACHAGEFITPLLPYVVNESFYVMSSVAAEEYAIAFTSEDAEDWSYSEPLFSGIISAHFWSEALTTDAADENNDTYISMQEMYDFSFPKIRKIYGEVFEYEPELADFVLNNTGYIDNYPNPHVIQSLPDEFSLHSQYLDKNIDPLPGISQKEQLPIILGSIGGIVIIIAIGVPLILRKKKIKNTRKNQNES